MNPELPPLPDELNQLVSAERGFPPVPAALEAKLWAAIGSQLPILPKPAVPATSPPTGGALTKLGPLAVAFALGGGVGALVHAAVVRPREIVRIVEVPGEVPANVPAPPAQLPVPQATPTGKTGVRAPLRTPSPSKRLPAPRMPSSPLPDDPALAQERALLEMGRTALSRGQSDAAYRAMVDHERRFPHGRLAEERDAVRIQALVGLGQLDAARLLADAFAKDYPHSLLRPAVERALAGSDHPARNP